VNAFVGSVRAFSFLEVRHFVSVSDKKMAGFDTMLAVKERETGGIMRLNRKNICKGAFLLERFSGDLKGKSPLV
jgi:hypothetical protein